MKPTFIHSITRRIEPYSSIEKKAKVLNLGLGFARRERVESFTPLGGMTDAPLETKVFKTLSNEGFAGPVAKIPPSSPTSKVLNPSR